MHADERTDRCRSTVVRAWACVSSCCASSSRSAISRRRRAERSAAARAAAVSGPHPSAPPSRTSIQRLLRLASSTRLLVQLGLQPSDLVVLVRDLALHVPEQRIPLLRGIGAGDRSTAGRRRQRRQRRQRRVDLLGSVLTLPNAADSLSAWRCREALLDDWALPSPADLLGWRTAREAPNGGAPLVGGGGMRPVGACSSLCCVWVSCGTETTRPSQGGAAWMRP